MFREEKYATLACYMRNVHSVPFACGNATGASHPGVRFTFAVICPSRADHTVKVRALHALAHHFENCRRFLIKIHSTRESLRDGNARIYLTAGTSLQFSYNMKFFLRSRAKGK